MSSADITGLVLAGGLGTRMGGKDKGWIEWQGQPLVLHVLGRLQPQVCRLIISANRNRERYEQLGFPVVADRAQDSAGPLAGLQAGLAECRTPLLAVVPCDAPFVPLDLVSRLHDALSTSNARAAVVRTGEGLQPAFLLCQRTLLASLDAWLADGNRKLGGWLASVNAVQVHFDDAAAFSNFNSPEDMA